MKATRESAIQSTAELIFRWLQQISSPRDGIAALMMAQAAMIWTQRPSDEETVRKLLAEYSEGVVALWKVQNEAKIRKAS
jgi:hypothetical protein